MKKIYIGILSAICLMSLSACGKATTDEPAGVEVESRSYVIDASSPEMEIRQGETKAIEYTVSGEAVGEDAIVKFRSSDDEIATVNKDGEVTGVGIGTAKIYGYIEGKRAYEWTITVSETCTITSDTTEMQIEVGDIIETKSLYEVTGASDGEQVALSSSDTTIVEITENGDMIGNSSGRAMITLTCGVAEPICWDVEVIEISISEVEAACERLVEDLSTYEYVKICESQLREVGDQAVIDLNDKEITRAAGFTCPSDPEDVINLEALDSGEYRLMSGTGEYAEYSGVELSEAGLDQACKGLFGRDANPDSLSTTGNDICDVIKLADGAETIVSMWCNFDNEMDFIIRDSRVEKGETGYILEQNVYCGYWGSSRFEKSNYKITCGIKREKDSTHGYIVSSMKIQRTDDETQWREAMVSTADPAAPFYGIWCYGVKTEAEAQRGLDELNAKGLDGKMFITTDWSNLNAEKCYVVTAGVYGSEEDAKNALSDVKNAGYSGAYVKYSGDYIGD